MNASRGPGLRKIAVRYISEVAAATVGAVGVGTAVAVFVGELTHRPPTLLDGPIPLAPIIAAILLALAISLKFGSCQTGVWVWAAGIVNFAIFLHDWTRLPYTWASVWNNFFGRGCSDSECLYELFATAPLYTSITYSITAWIYHLLQKNRSAPVDRRGTGQVANP